MELQNLTPATSATNPFTPSSSWTVTWECTLGPGPTPVTSVTRPSPDHITSQNTAKRFIKAARLKRLIIQNKNILRNLKKYSKPCGIRERKGERGGERVGRKWGQKRKRWRYWDYFYWNIAKFCLDCEHGWADGLRHSFSFPDIRYSNLRPSRSGNQNKNKKTRCLWSFTVVSILSLDLWITINNGLNINILPY